MIAPNIFKQGVPRQTRVYIAGPMRGKPAFNFDAFFNAEAFLREKGYEVVNPARLDVEVDGFDPRKATTIQHKPTPPPLDRLMARDLQQICCVDAIVLLDDWEKSEGVAIELHLARLLQKPVGLYSKMDVLSGSIELVSTVTPEAWKVTTTGEERIVDQRTGGAKGQKLARFDLIPYKALWELAEIYGRGAKKYADDNWRKGYSWKLSIGALERHLNQWKQGHKRDEDGNHHIMQVAWHCITLFTFELLGLGTDDRYVEDPRRVSALAIKTGECEICGGSHCEGH